MHTVTEQKTKLEQKKNRLIAEENRLKLKDSLTSQSNIKDQWTKTGTAAFDQEQQQKTAVILKLEAKPSLEIRSHIRSHSLKWNHLRNEWYGYVLDVQNLKNGLGDLKYELQIIQD